MSGCHTKYLVGGFDGDVDQTPAINIEAAGHDWEGSSVGAPPLWSCDRGRAVRSLLPSVVLQRLAPGDLTLHLAAEHGLSWKALERCLEQLLTDHPLAPASAAAAVVPAAAACVCKDGSAAQYGMVPVKRELEVDMELISKEHFEDKDIEEELDGSEEKIELKEEPLFGDNVRASPPLVGYLSSELGNDNEEDESSSDASSSPSPVPSTNHEPSPTDPVTKSSKKSPLRYTCPHCSYNSIYKNNLLRHLPCHNREKKLRFKCAHCDYWTDRKEFLKRHLLVTHKTSKQKTFSCDQCSFSSNWKHCYKKHLLFHTKDREKYTCDECGYTTEWKYYLDAHMLCHKSKTEKRLACSYCDYRTDLKRSIRRHVVCHESAREKPFACDHCTYKTDLKFHLRRHLLAKHVK